MAADQRPGVDARGPLAAAEAGRALRLAVLGDSTAFTDATGPQLPGAGTTYPQLTADRLAARFGLEVTTTVIARAGSTAGELERTLLKDRHVQFDVVAPADAIVLGIGSFDHAPAGTPAVVDALVPFITDDARRRRARQLAHRAYPRLVALRGGYATRTPWPVFARRYRRILEQLIGLTWSGAPIIALGPTSHRAAYYGHRHPGHGLAERAQLDLAHQLGASATIATWPLVLGHLDALNPDGIHWPAGVHMAVADEIDRRLADRWSTTG